MLYYCNLMKKYFLFIIIMLFITNCANLDFVYESNKQIFIELKNNTSLIIIGDEADEVNAYIVSFLESTNNKNPNYQLSINSKITEEAQVIGKDAIASKFSIEYHIGYSLYNINKKCKIIEAEIVTKDSYDSKSAGYSFGTDLSEKETRKKIISKNIDQFIAFVNRYDDLTSCNGEN